MACTALLLSGVGTVGPVARAVTAEPVGGSGRFEPVIDWIDWSGATNTVSKYGKNVVNDGVTSQVWSTPARVAAGYWRAAKCSLYVADTHFERVENGLVVKSNDEGLHVGYDPGSWQGDGFAHLYNNGSLYTNGVHKGGGDFRSGLDVGLAHVQGGEHTTSADAYFQVECRVYLLRSATRPVKAALESLPRQEIPVEGFVYADAESSNWIHGNYEAVTIDPIPVDGRRRSDVTYRLLESVRSPGCPTTSWGGEATFPYPGGERSGFRMRSDGRECAGLRSGGYGAASAVLMPNARGGYVELKGGGVSAVAFGVATFIDTGDAPESYGEAVSVFQPVWRGGLIGGSGSGDVPRSGNPAGTQGDWYNLTSAQESGRLASVQRGVVGLGSRIDADIRAVYSPGADGDDRTNSVGQPRSGGDPNDEDGLLGPKGEVWDKKVPVAPGIVWAPQVVCTGEGKIAGWLDWDMSGTFEEGERSEVIQCPASGRASLRFRVPDSVSRDALNGQRAYLRLRITGDRGRDGAVEEPQPSGVSLTGEVEDYLGTFKVVPMLSLVKAVEDPDGVAESPLEPRDWELSATVVSNGKVLASGDGGFKPVEVPTGAIRLTESSARPEAAGYQLERVACVNMPGTTGRITSTYNAASQTLTVRGADWIQCTLTNRPVPGSVSWRKTGPDGAVVRVAQQPGTGLHGARWRLTGPSHRQGVEVDDCVATNALACTGLDKDPAAGELEVTGLKWGDYSLAETQAPTGYVAAGEEMAFSPVGGASLAGTLVPGGAVSDGGVMNALETGSVSWRKVDGHSREPLGGTSWTLTGPGLPPGTVVQDCEAEPCGPGAYRDEDPLPGAFRVGGLAWSSERYSLVEQAAPAGYALDRKTVHDFMITSEALHYQFSDPFENRKVVVPALPLTGGMGADSFWLAGSAVAALALVAGWLRRRLA
ncbi:CshA/CshB family fibrillar adhesin-related protein [Actinomyces weissii]|uniref:LPXTG cell wall anchor domain-containing protein n=1 Tax=Actinomyces weissii TaxID=675090 RepID=A0A7T7S2I9_9ACTO|nr:CshA/CshB family fibrillar adhesin-related protein [Actinomyces weissii]QQM67740.1 hypothetical protein JG540_02330 [Actinomyces weissii]